MSTPANPGRSILPWLAVLGGVGSLAAGAAVAGLILHRFGEGGPIPPRPAAPATAALSQKALAEQVHQACTACHVYPSPRSFPRWAWKGEIEQAYTFIETLKP